MIVVLFLETGMRAGEVVRLKIQDIELGSPERRIIVKGIGSKSKKDRVVYLSETTRVLESYSRQGPYSPIPEFFLNRFAEPFAVHFLKQRRPMNVLQKTLERASLSTTSITSRADKDELKNYFASSLLR